MGCEQMMDRMSFILAGENLKRVIVKKNAEGKPQITVDLHGMDCRTAKRVIKSIIAMYRFSFDLVLIHGFNHGTALKTLINTDIVNDRIMSKKSPSYNPGLTVMAIA